LTRRSLVAWGAWRCPGTVEATTTGGSMPGPIVHLIVQQRLATSLRRSERGAGFAKLLEAEPCSPYAGFGAQGPDFLFFSLREYGSAIGDLSNFIFSVYDTIEPIIEFVEDAIEPIKTAIDDVVSAVLPDELEALLKELGETADTLGSAVLGKLGEIVTNEVDLFYPFYPKIQAGAPETDWYWFDFLHYRRTGTFCSNMFKLAQGDDDLVRYCLGYASHIGTDVVGHPFVNSIVGGPYRDHWHRHKLVENWIDAWARRHYADSPTLRSSCLRLGPDDHYRPDSISGSYYSRLCEFPGGKMPPKLSKLFVDALHLTYDDIDHPPDFQPADVDTAYRLWIRWFERATSIGDALPPTPPPPPGSAAAALVSEYGQEISQIWSGAGSGGGGGGGGGFSIWGIFAAIADFIRRLIETIAKTIEFLITHITDILLLPVTEALRLVRWLIYQVHLGLWQIYDEARFALVLGGYLFPDERDLSKSPWAAAFTNAGSAHLTGGPPAAFMHYPHKRQAYQLFGQTEIHLQYPATLNELPSAEPCPLPHFGALPDAMIDRDSGDPAADAFFACTQPYPPNPADLSLEYTHNVEAGTWHDAQLGSALPFSTRLIAERMSELPNFNLDGDRGYGFKTWRLDGLSPTDPEVKPAKIESNPVDVSYGPTV
jgi:Zinc dependent phospholipase C